MKTQQILCSLVVVFALPLLQGCTSMRRDMWFGIRDGNRNWRDYNKEQGGFVEVPADIGTAVGVPTVVLAPVVWILTAPLRSGLEGLEDLYDPMEFFPELVGNVVAIPFWGIKQVFVDCPRALFQRPLSTPVKTQERKHNE